MDHVPSSVANKYCSQLIENSRHFVESKGEMPRPRRPPPDPNNSYMNPIRI
jgi:hypothetical protein